ncbi:Mitogen-activated protein kinase-binding protein 1 [Actinomortierella wolfii]|nr:Mitogen-activated protein kinase-binding protein 1 [Actinomortierella wolfii]
MSRKPTRGPLQTPLSSSQSSRLTTPDPPYLRPTTTVTTAGQQRPRSGSDVLPRSPTKSIPFFSAPLTASLSTAASSGVTTFDSIVSTPTPSTTCATVNLSTPTGVTAVTASPAASQSRGAGGGAGIEVAGPRSATSTPATSAGQRSELRRNKRKEATNYHIQLERVLGLTVARPSALSMNKKMGLVAYVAGCVVVLYDYHRGVQIGSLACSSLTASWTCPPSSDDEPRQPISTSHASPSLGPASTGSGSSQYWQSWMNHPMASPFVNPLAGLMPMNASHGGVGTGGGGHLQHASADLLPPPSGGGFFSSTSPSNRKTDSESSSKVPASQKPKPISCLAFSPDGQYLAVGETGHQPRILVWDVVQRVPVVELIGHQFGVQALQFSSNGKILVSLGFQHDGFVHVWNWRSRLKLATNKVTSKVNALIPHNADGAVTHAGTTTLSFITVGLRHVKFWYLGQSKAHARAGIADIRLLDGRSAMLGEMRDANFVDAVSSPDGEQTYLITSNGVLCMLNKERAMDKFVDLQVRAGYSVSMDGNCIICSCSDGIIRLFEPVTLQYYRTLPLPSPLGYSPSTIIDRSEANEVNMYSDVAVTLFDADTEQLFSIYCDRSIRIWAFSQDSDEAILQKAHLNHSDCVWGVETIPKSKQGSTIGDFMTYSADGTVRFWGANASNTESREADGYDDLALLHVLYPDSNFHQWFTSPEIQASDLTGASAPMESGIRVARISPTGDLLATGDRGGNLRVHDLRTMAEITYQEAHENDILAIDFTSPTQQAVMPTEDSVGDVHEKLENEESIPFFVATAGRDRLLHVFDIRDGFRLVQTLDDHSSSITCLRLSPDGTTLVSGGADKSVVFRALQETETGPKFFPYHHAPGRATVYDMALVPSNGTITSISGDRRIYVYNVKSGKATKSVKADVPCLDGSLSVSNNAGPASSLSQGGLSGSLAGGSGGATGLGALPPSSSLGVVENCSMTHLDLDPSGTIAIASGSDKSIRVYDLMQKVCLARMVCHSESITGVRLSSSFKHIYSTSGDGCVLVWRLSSSLVRKIESRQQMVQDKLSAIASQEQAQRIMQQDGDDIGSVAGEVELPAEGTRRSHRWRSLSQSAATSQFNTQSALPPPLPQPRTLSPSPTAQKTRRYSPSMDRQLNILGQKDGLSAGDILSSSRRNSEASVISEDANDHTSAEELSSSDGIAYPDRQRQEQQGASISRPGTPSRKYAKRSHETSSYATKYSTTETNDPPFQVSIASPESLLIHKRLPRVLAASSGSTTPTGGRSRTNSTTSPSLQPLSTTSKGTPRPTTPTSTQQASSITSSSSSSGLANRPVWGRAPLSSAKAVTPGKGMVSASGNTQPTRTRQRTTSIISGRISFIASNNTIDPLKGSLTDHNVEQDQEQGSEKLRASQEKTTPQQFGKLAQQPSQGSESDQNEDQLSDTTVASDMDESELSQTVKAKLQQGQEGLDAHESDHCGSLPEQSFPDGEDMAVNRHALGHQQQLQRASVRSSTVQSIVSPVSARPGRQSLSLKFLSGRPQPLEDCQLTASVAEAGETTLQATQMTVDAAVSDSVTSQHGDISIPSPVTNANNAPSTAVEGHLKTSSLNRLSNQQTKLQRQQRYSDGAKAHPFVDTNGATHGLNVDKTRQLPGMGASIPPSSSFGVAPGRPSSMTLSVSESFQSLAVGELDHPVHVNGSNGNSISHVLASPAFVKSPVVDLKSPSHGAVVMDGNASSSTRLATTTNNTGMANRLHETLDTAKPLQLSEDEMEVDDDNNVDGGDHENRVKAIATLMDQLQVLLFVSPPQHQPSAEPLDRAILEETKDRLLQMVGCIQGQLWLMQTGNDNPSRHQKAAGSIEQ